MATEKSVLIPNVVGVLVGLTTLALIISNKDHLYRLFRRDEFALQNRVPTPVSSLEATGNPQKDPTAYSGFVNFQGEIQVRRVDGAGRRLVDSGFDVGPDGEWFAVFDPPLSNPHLVSVSRPGYLRDEKRVSVGNASDLGKTWKIYPGDIDGNDVIDEVDLRIVTFFARPALPSDHPGFRQLGLPKGLQHIDEDTCDLDSNGKVDAGDIKLVTMNLGRRTSPVM